MANLDFNYLINGQVRAGNFDEFVSAITSSLLPNWISANANLCSALCSANKWIKIVILNQCVFRPEGKREVQPFPENFRHLAYLKIQVKYSQNI